jgi:hypothetical protein
LRAWAGGAYCCLLLATGRPHGRDRRIVFHPLAPRLCPSDQTRTGPYRDSLECIPEYRLASEPLEIDVVIDKNIARIFKGVNILEHKSPGDYFSAADFHKVLGYVFLYAALNDVSLTDLTLSIIETRRLRELFSYVPLRKKQKVYKKSYKKMTLKCIVKLNTMIYSI